MRFVIAVEGATDDDFQRICQWFLDHYGSDKRPDVTVALTLDEGGKTTEALLWDVRRIFGSRLRHLEVIPKAPRREAGGPS